LIFSLIFFQLEQIRTAEQLWRFHQLQVRIYGINLAQCDSCGNKCLRIYFGTVTAKCRFTFNFRFAFYFSIV